MFLLLKCEKTSNAFSKYARSPRLKKKIKILHLSCVNQRARQSKIHTLVISQKYHLSQRNRKRYII